MSMWTAERKWDGLGMGVLDQQLQWRLAILLSSREMELLLMIFAFLLPVSFRILKSHKVQKSRYWWACCSVIRLLLCSQLAGRLDGCRLGQLIGVWVVGLDFVCVLGINSRMSSNRTFFVFISVEMLGSDVSKLSNVWEEEGSKSLFMLKKSSFGSVG